MENIDYTAWRFYFDVMQLVGTAVIGIYVWLSNRNKANRSAIEKVDYRVSQINERVTLLENEVRHLPNHNDLGQIHDKVNDVAQGMSTVQGELTAINRTLGLINEHLINHGKQS